MIDPVQFPLSLNRMTSSPEYSTTIVAAGDGSEQRIGNWQDARLIVNAILGVRSLLDLQTLIKFFRARKGALRGFLYKDLVDYQAFGEAFGVGNGVNNTFQLVKSYSDAGNTDVRTIYRPVQTTITVYSDVTLLAEGVNYTVNYTTGVLTTISGPPPPAAVLTWYGEFFIPMRFAEDRLPADEIYFDLIEGKAAGEMPDIPMVELRGNEV